MTVTSIENAEQLADLFDEISDTPRELEAYLIYCIESAKKHRQYWYEQSPQPFELNTGYATRRDSVIQHITSHILDLEGALRRVLREKRAVCLNHEARPPCLM